MRFKKSFFIARGLNDRQPIGGETFFVNVADVQQELQVHVHDTRDIFGALNVTSHPVK